jgi:hypothetical protein
MALSRDRETIRSTHASKGFSEARSEGFDGDFYSSVTAKGNESEGYSSEAHVRGPIPVNYSLSAPSNRYSRFDRPNVTFQSSFKVYGPEYDVTTDSYGTGKAPYASAFGRRNWRTSRRAEIAGAAMANRIHEGRNINTGRSQ